ncbi:hypothetical protein [Peptacetobacter sp.]|uniref:hypothetical protein n=1 Tax=Peptacetobacter sp. TaxID=2991975 RepID=UPI00262D5F38|nr:hypothetical protein [Peptacetobacter sp.]
MCDIKFSDIKEVENFIKYFGKAIINGIDFYRLDKPQKIDYTPTIIPNEYLRFKSKKEYNKFKKTEKVKNEFLELMERTRISRRETRITIQILHNIYMELDIIEKELIKLRLINGEKWNCICKKIGYTERTLREKIKKAENKILLDYNELIKIDIDKSVYEDEFFNAFGVV